jgi:membrane protein required for colicin V production
MNYLDIVIIIPLLYGLAKGFSNGIIIELSNIISVFLAIYIGIHFSELVYPYLKIDILNDYSNLIPLIAFLIVFIVIMVIVKSIGEVINKITNHLALGLISKILGAVFGMTKIILICICLLLLATNYELIDRKTQNNSILLIPLQKASKIVLPEITKHKEKIIDATKEGTEKAKRSLEQKINQ